MDVLKRRRGLCIFPGYRWCGPGCSGPGAPINDVDGCCKIHDKCLRTRKSQCQCDQEFLECLRPKMSRHSDKGKKATIMYGYMKVQTLFTCKK
ncbi:phospholipase [Bacillus sp. Marseille-P3661]|uniref:phospholipase n=1 Tax=Bacillus sp. Marseille-P3661 TaxID=1936234 RepID=UPI000C847839|nr:phospholipase [Bacillus sp. Marseille-P3661]